MKSDVFMAEPVYIALQMAGYEGDAHDLVNHKAMELVANRHKITVLEALQILEEDDRELYKAYRNIPREVMSVLEAPESYIGVAAEKAKEICQKGRSYLSGIPTTTLFR
jgi:adenylosuccinate lyase